MIDVIFLSKGDAQVISFVPNGAPQTIFIQAGGSAQYEVAAHVAATDPHPQYTTAAELDAAVQAAVDALVDGAPGALDTLNELAAALADDASFASTVSTSLGNRLRVDAAQGLNGAQQQQGRDNLALGAIATGADTDDVPEGGGNLYFTDARARAAMMVAATVLADDVAITPAISAYTTRTLVTQANTQAAGTLTLNNPTGAPVDGQQLEVRLTCTNAQTLAFDTAYAFSNQLTQPTGTTGGGKTDWMLFEYRAAATAWVLVGILFGA